MSSKDGEKVAQELGCSYVETSARSRINVGELFCYIKHSTSMMHPLYSESIRVMPSGNRVKKSDYPS